jgi:hypothetical protein
MQNAKIKKVIIPSLLLIGFGMWFYANTFNSDKKAQELVLKKELLKSSELVWDLWKNGKDSKLFSQMPSECEVNIKESDRCSIKLLKCLLPKSNLQTSRTKKNKIQFFGILKTNKLTSNGLSVAEGARVIMGVDEIKITLLLEKSCNKIFLPKRNYGFGIKKNPDWNEQFDNFEQNIFIDKEMTPANGKSLTEMQNHCSLRGMQLLESHILDAASFHPVDLRNNRPKYFIRPQLPWTRNFKSEYIYSAQKDANFIFEKKYCNFIYSKECTKYENTSLPSWMGLRNPLGSLLEVVRNPLNPSQKLVPTSIYFSIHSMWHRLGLRAGWTGESIALNDFEFTPFKGPDEENLRNLKMGFRCMQEEFLR